LFIDIAADVNVESEGLLEVGHHLPGPSGTEDAQRLFAAHDPSREPEIR
jgi:hypothetical protein